MSDGVRVDPGAGCFGDEPRVRRTDMTATPPQARPSTGGMPHVDLRSREGHKMQLRRAAFPRRRRGLAGRCRDQMPPLRHAQFPEADRARTRTPRASLQWRRRLWIYIPKEVLTAEERSEGSRCAREPGAWSSASQSQNPDIRLSATSSATPLPQACSWRGWRTRPYVTRLSGTIFPPSTLARGVASWISSRPAIPVSPSPSPAGVRERAIRVISGPTLPASSPSASRNGCSLRTSPGISASVSTESPQNFKAWATASRQACSRRLRRALRIGESGSSYWPTPTTGMAGNRTDVKVTGTGFIFAPALDQTGSQVSLGTAAKSWSLLYRLARATGWHPGPARTYPFSLPLHVTLRPGTRSSRGDLTWNPRFGEWVMGWPIGWSDPSSSVTGFARWLQQSRGALSEKLTQARRESDHSEQE